MNSIFHQQVSTHSILRPGIDVPVTEHTRGFALNSDIKTWNCICSVEYSCGVNEITRSVCSPPRMNPMIRIKL